MNDPQPGPNKPQQQAPDPVPVGPYPVWAMIIGAIFGGVTLLFLFGFAFLAGTGYSKFICDSFQLLAAAFALGTAFSAAFLGGGAAAQGSFGNAAQNKSLVFSVAGGIAVVVISFFVFSSLQPKNCTVAELQLEFGGIPKIYSALVEHFFSRPEFDDGPTGETLSRRLTVQIQDKTDFGRVHVYDSASGTEICVLPIYSYTQTKAALASLRSGYKLTGPNTEPSGKPIRFDYVGAKTPRIGVDAIKAGLPLCFAYAKDSNNIFSVGVISHDGNILYGTDVIKEPSYDKKNLTGEALNRINRPLDNRSFVSTISSFITRAFAQNDSQLTPYADLRATLTNPDAAIRIQGRRYLEQHFDIYASYILKDLFLTGQDPLYLENMLYGLVAGIDAANDGALTPGKKRNLNSLLPYVAGKEAELIELTGHPAEGVKKQARRLIQRFPVNAFDPVYNPLISRAAEKDCNLGRLVTTAQGILYGSIFYNYNRIVENVYATPQASIFNDVEARAQAIRSMATTCLDKSLAIDAAVVDYGRAILYAKWKSYPSQAKQAAKLFLSEVQSDQEDYYLSVHITQMQQLSAK
jgi:hypothetical protein